jgi:hypothetical protein
LVPAGLFRGEVLAWLPRPADQRLLTRPLLWAMFGLSPFGVDFDRRRWYFLSPRAPRLGHFVPVIGPSRWRDATTIQLHYQVSRLPRPIRATLYDEVKPLRDGLCLGLGGLDAGRGPGEQFFFALERV